MAKIKQVEIKPDRTVYLNGKHVATIASKKLPGTNLFRMYYEGSHDHTTIATQAEAIRAVKARCN